MMIDDVFKVYDSSPQSSSPKGCNELSFNSEMVMNVDTTESIDDEMDFKINRISDYLMSYITSNDEDNQTKHYNLYKIIITIMSKNPYTRINIIFKFVF